MACDAVALSNGGAPAASANAQAADAVVHFNLDDDRLEALELEETTTRDFMELAPSDAASVSAAAAPPALAPTHPVPEVRRMRRADRQAEVERLQAAEAELRERGDTLEQQMEAQERKLTAASRSVAKTRSQVKQLTAQLGLKELQGSRCTREVEELRRLLVERELQLQEALDDCDAALGLSRGAEDDDDEALDPQDGTFSIVSSGPGAAAMSAEDEESLLQLMRVTEDLTDALETAKVSEEAAKRQLADSVDELRREEALTEQCRRRLDEAKEAREAEVAALQARLRDQEQAIAAERARSRALQSGPGLEHRGGEPEGEPAGLDTLEPDPLVDHSDPEVAAAEQAARAALEAMKLYGTRSAAKAGLVASKKAGHLSHVAGGGLLRNTLARVRRTLASTPAPPPPPSSSAPVETATQDATETKPAVSPDWNKEPIEV